MNEIVEKIKQELITRCNKYNEKYNYDFWNDHIKYVVKNATGLAKKYGADVEIVELGALLHDIAMPSEYGSIEEHNIYGVEIADELLTKLDYPQDRKERVKECVLRHRGSKDLPRNTIEEQCVADADVMAHFDCIPSLFHIAFGKNEMDLTIEEGTEFIKKKLERDYNKLSPRTKEILTDRYKNIKSVLFVQVETIEEYRKIDACKYIGKEVYVKIDRPLGSSHPKYPNHIYLVNYGFVPNTISGDGDELDCYILGEYKPVKEYKGKCIAVIHRLNDDDDKLIIVAENKNYTDNEIRLLTDFQEMYYKSVIIR